jgi:glutamyl-Q tRNA(Asp) synthetase
MSGPTGLRPALRFAPSPNGALHLGHALSAILNHDMARGLGGRFLVRIEDIDTVRCPRPLAQAALDDLAWLGLTWEEPVRFQSEHFADYRAAAAQLEALGLLYPCFATRSEIASAARPGAADPDGAPLYPGLWRDAPAARIAGRRQRGEPCALRLDMARALERLRGSGIGQLTFQAMDGAGRIEEAEARPELWGDVVIVRKDTPTSYHLSVVVDDALQGISHVVRGLDLLPATGLHRLLQCLLGLPAPVYHHHRLLTDETGRKLAKSARDTSLAALRQQGWTPADVRRRVGSG